MLNKHDETITEGKDLGLVKLRDIEVLSNPELEEVIELYRNKSAKKENNEEYQKYSRVFKRIERSWVLLQ